MQKIAYLFVFIFFSCGLYAQNGLEKIQVEKYYKSNANDTLANPDGGKLPVGSVTYRIYVDMLPDYKFQAAYGVDVVPIGSFGAGDHELRIATTTLFFNNEDRGDVYPNYTKAQAKANTVMLDSWLSAGAACTGNFGVPKNEDTDSLATVVNNYSPPVIQNNDTSCGIPVSQQDGLVAGTPGIFTQVGISSEIAVFGSQNDGTNGPVFSTFNGSWACLGGSMGPDSLTNKVLIAQITTNGQLSFELNIQIGTPSGGVENYVATNPVGQEISIPSLIYLSTLDTTAALPLDGRIENNRLEVYPNPAKNFAILKMTGENENVKSGNLRIFSLNGSLVRESEITFSDLGVFTLDTQQLPGGYYLIQVESESNVYQSKLMLD